MFKHMMLVLTFVAAFGAIGAGVSEKADAWGRWRRPYVTYYYEPSPVYYYDEYVPYRTYHRGYYGPRFNYYEPYYSDYYYYDRPGAYYGGPRGRVAFRLGW